MAEESKRGVTANKDLLLSLRKRKSWTIEKLAHNAGVGLRTAQNACGGERVSMAVLCDIAEALGVPYEALLVDENPPAVAKEEPLAKEPGVIHIQIDLSGCASDPAKMARLAEVVAFLQKFLPDNAAIGMVAILGGVGVINVGRSAANEAVLADDGLQKAMDALGVKDWTQAGPPRAMVDLLDPNHTSHYLTAARENYENGSNRPWDELSAQEQHDCYIAHMRMIGEGMWRGRREEFQGLLDEAKLILHPRNYAALHQWGGDYLFNKLHLDYPDTASKGYSGRYQLIFWFRRWITYLDGAEKFKMMRDRGVFQMTFDMWRKLDHPDS